MDLKAMKPDPLQWDGRGQWRYKGYKISVGEEGIFTAYKPVPATGVEGGFSSSSVETITSEDTMAKLREAIDKLTTAAK